MNLYKYRIAILPSDKGVDKGVSRCQTLGRIQCKAFVQKVDKREEHLDFLIVALRGGRWDQSCTEVSAGLLDENIPSEFLMDCGYD